MYLNRVVNSLIIGMQGRYNKTARILKMELRVSVKKPKIHTWLFALDCSYDWDQCVQSIALPNMGSHKA
jgi:hypothetical protein